MKLVFSSLLILLLGSCTLAENKKNEEVKDYTDTVHKVELVDYEFEERLNSFYESEPIENEDLYDLYDGEFPDGERNPKELRIHWKDARELALAELELQKPIHTHWKDATISERPILVLDRDGGDFYRYYEYRIVKGTKFLGAIRIPAYRRTENFATAEVHFYSDDEKTYTIHPTGWGQYMAENSELKGDNSFYFKIVEELSALFINENFAFNWYYRQNSYNNLDSTLPNISENHSYQIQYDYIYELIRKIKIPGKKVLKENQLNYITGAMSKSNSTSLAQQMTDIANFMALNTATINQTEKNGTAYLSPIFSEVYREIYKYAIDTVLSNMQKPTVRNFLDTGLSKIYWDKLEPVINSENIEYLKINWQFDTNLTDNSIFPKINFRINKLNQYSPNSTDMLTKYRYVLSKDYTKETTPELFFQNSEGETISFNEENISGQKIEELLKKTLPENKTPDLPSTRNIILETVITQIDSHIWKFVDALHATLHPIVPISKMKLFSFTKSTLMTQSTIDVLFTLIAKDTEVSVEQFNDSFWDSLFLELRQIVKNSLDGVDILIGYNWGTLGIALAVADLGPEIDNAYNNNIKPHMNTLKQLHSYITRDYEKFMSTVYQAVINNSADPIAGEKEAKELVNTLYRLTIAVENLLEEDKGGDAIIDAYRSLVKKWLIWYIPILPFPVGDWWTKDKHGVIHLLPRATMPLAYAQYWFDVDSGPVPTPPDDNEVPMDTPSIFKKHFEQEWNQVNSWRMSQEFTRDKALSIEQMEQIISRLIFMMDKILNECKKEHDHKENCDLTIDKDNKKIILKDYINGEFKNEVQDLAGKTYNWTQFTW